MNIYRTPKELSEWIAQSHKGDRFVYHVGHLLHDRKFRVKLAGTGGFADVPVIPLQNIATAALEAYWSGYVVLVQKRLGEDTFQYLAIRTRKYVQPPMAGETHGS
jgi:hypothetical protein